MSLILWFSAKTSTGDKHKNIIQQSCPVAVHWTNVQFTVLQMNLQQRIKQDVEISKPENPKAYTWVSNFMMRARYTLVECYFVLTLTQNSTSDRLSRTSVKKSVKSRLEASNMYFWFRDKWWEKQNFYSKREPSWYIELERLGTTWSRWSLESKNNSTFNSFWSGFETLCFFSRCFIQKKVKWSINYLLECMLLSWIAVNHATARHWLRKEKKRIFKNIYMNSFLTFLLFCFLDFWQLHMDEF